LQRSKPFKLNRSEFKVISKCTETFYRTGTRPPPLPQSQVQTKYVMCELRAHKSRTNIENLKASVLIRYDHTYNYTKKKTIN
jgi:hypothetical protein